MKNSNFFKLGFISATALCLLTGCTPSNVNTNPTEAPTTAIEESTEASTDDCTAVITGDPSDDEILCKKPVIYLYPQEKTDVNIQLNLKGSLICTYPEYNNGWNVTANPDGTLINKADNKEYSYLFWEATSNVEYDMSKGFVVKGCDTAEFLQDKLSYLGLTPKEYNEFITYWLPQMQNNNYNLITFQNSAYTDNFKLNVTPKPDSVLRVFMAYKPLEEKIEIEEPALQQFNRTGFSLVEWGGTMVK